MRAPDVRPRTGWRGWGLVALASIVTTGCGQPEPASRPRESGPEGREEPAFATPEELEAEMEILDHEIGGLSEYLTSRPRWQPVDPADSDPGTVLQAARAAREAAGRALAAADTPRAADSLDAAAARVEHVKRLLGVAEEMGVDLGPDEESPPALE